MIQLKKGLKLNETRCLILILCYGFLTNIYIICRYGGLVAYGDTSRVTKWIQDFQVHGGVGNYDAYPNGLGFQILATEISDITGLTIPQVQLLPFGFFYLIVAYLLFREFSDNKTTALIGAVILSLLPDLLFFMTWGTHEQHTFFFFLLALFILMRYSKNSHSFQKSAAYLAILYSSLITIGLLNQWFFYLILIAIISTTFLGLLQSFIFKTDGTAYKKMLFSIIPIILLSYILYATYSNNMPIYIIRLWYGKLFALIPHGEVLPLLGLAIVLVLIFFVVHKWSRHFIFQQGINTQIDNLKKIRLDSRRLYFITLLLFLVWLAFVYFFIAPSNSSFRSPAIYFLLTGIYWIILPISGIMSLIIVKRYVIDKKCEYTQRNFCVLFFVSFFGLFALSVLMDRIIHSGIGDNLEFRVFSYLLVFSACIAACAVSEISAMIAKTPWKKIFLGLIIVTFMLFSISSLLKAPSDPLVSDSKIFYTPEEKNGIEWIEINGLQRSVWFDDGRFSNVFRFESSYYAFKNVRVTQENTADVFMITDDYLSEMENLDTQTKVYDNADVMIFRKS